MVGPSGPPPLPRQAVGLAELGDVVAGLSIAPWGAPTEGTRGVAFTGARNRSSTHRLPGLGACNEASPVRTTASMFGLGARVAMVGVQVAMVGTSRLGRLPAVCHVKCGSTIGLPHLELGWAAVGIGHTHLCRRQCPACRASRQQGHPDPHLMQGDMRANPASPSTSVATTEGS